ncbi:hypothetical protein RND81_08G051900 [Saponaria officinalis]|uniref:Sulfate transporter n=1 Tax=Saponaria officinalis TaxID=3572 RepID=A0AAW1J2V2_SAPOF
MESQEIPQTQYHASPNQSQSPPQKVPYNLWGTLEKSLSFKSKWGELNGAMGDLGTFIPIILALTLARNLDLGTTLIFTGVYNILTGAIYGVPMPVQPMKSIAAIMAAGICTGGILLVLGVTQLMQLVYWLVPLSVVRGIQLSQGLSFAISAVKYIRTEQNFVKSKSRGDRPWLGLDGLLLATICACFIILVSGGGNERKREITDADLKELNNNNNNNDDKSEKKGLRRVLYALPSAFIIFMLGGPSEVGKGFKFGPTSIKIVKISKQSWKDGFVKGTIPQLPLSVLNSVIAVCKLSSDLFPERDFTATSLSVTVRMMNLVGCWFGAVPNCHGAGGLAGQYKFGGRNGGCVALLGAAKLIIGVVLGSSIVKIFDQFPVGVLGVLLLFADLKLAMACRDMNTKEESFVMLLVTAVSLVESGASLGFLCGIVTHFLLKLRVLERSNLFLNCGCKEVNNFIA